MKNEKSPSASVTSSIIPAVEASRENSLKVTTPKSSRCPYCKVDILHKFRDCLPHCRGSLSEDLEQVGLHPETEHEESSKKTKADHCNPDLRTSVPRIKLDKLMKKKAKGVDKRMSVTENESNTKLVYGSMNRSEHSCQPRILQMPKVVPINESASRSIHTPAKEYRSSSAGRTGSLLTKLSDPSRKKVTKKTPQQSTACNSILQAPSQTKKKDQKSWLQAPHFLVRQTTTSLLRMHSSSLSDYARQSEWTRFPRFVMKDENKGGQKRRRRRINSVVEAVIKGESTLRRPTLNCVSMKRSPIVDEYADTELDVGRNGIVVREVNVRRGNNACTS